MTIEELLRLLQFARWNEMAFAESRRKLENQYIALNAFARRGQAVMAGDSIVELFPLQEFLGGRIYNRGVGGDTSGDTLRRLERIVLPLQPSLTLLWVGTNDIEAGVPLSQTRKRFRTWRRSERGLRIRAKAESFCCPSRRSTPQAQTPPSVRR